MASVRGVDQLRMPITEHLDWMRVRGLSPESIIQRHNIIAKIGRDIGKPVLEATEADLAAWQRGLTVAPVTCCNYVGNVHAFYRWARDAERTTSTADRVLIRPRKPRGVPRPIPEPLVCRAAEPEGFAHFAGGAGRLPGVLGGLGLTRARSLWILACIARR